MAKKLKWGLIGTGRIACKFAAGLAESKTGELAAIGSRSLAQAQSFAADFPARAYGSYAELLADPEVEVVYISTPHPFHAEAVIQAAKAGKHILCEKPFAMNQRETDAALAAAWKGDIFLMEAFMYRCHPQTLQLRHLLRNHAIGSVRSIRASFSFTREITPEHRLMNLRLGGGGILDVGCYCASMARLIAGEAHGKPFIEPDEVKGVARFSPTGVDEFALASLQFPGGILAELTTGVQLQLENNVQIVGTGGTLLIPSPWKASTDAGFSKIIRFQDGIPEELVIEADRNIYAYEADHVAEQIAAGRRESPAMTWEDTLGNMKTLDRWRESIGLSYPADLL